MTNQYRVVRLGDADVWRVECWTKRWLSATYHWKPMVFHSILDCGEGGGHTDFYTQAEACRAAASMLDRDRQAMYRAEDNWIAVDCDKESRTT